MIEKIIKPEFSEKRIPSSHDSIYDFSENSEESVFYNQLFEENKISGESTLLDKIKRKDSGQRIQSLQNINSVVKFLKGYLNPDQIIIEIGGGVHQERSGYIYREFLNYYPIDISYSSIHKYVNKYNRPGIVADATRLPFEDNSIDAIFTHTFLEHTHKPDKVLEEIIRVLKPGGVIIHADAWNCRWWQRYGVVGLKNFSGMSAKEKLIGIAAYITELRIVRFPPIVIKRGFRLLLNPIHKPSTLSFKKLKPNYELFLGCDEDAACSIDPIEVMLFYLSRNFKEFHPTTQAAKMFFRNPFIILQKRS